MRGEFRVGCTPRRAPGFRAGQAGRRLPISLVVEQEPNVRVSRSSGSPTGKPVARWRFCGSDCQWDEFGNMPTGNRGPSARKE